MIRLLFRLSLMVLVIFTCSCQKDNESDPSEESERDIVISGYGGSVNVDLGTGSWKIQRVRNTRANADLFGDILYPNGKTMRSNVLLKMDALGAIQTSGSDWGIKVAQLSPGIFEISMLENTRDENLHIALNLINENQSYTIRIEQQVSAGYDIQDIVYFLDQHDGDSVFMRNSLMTYTFSKLSAGTVEISPFGGANVSVNRRFVADNQSTVSPKALENLRLPIPQDIIDGEVVISEKQQKHGEIVNQTYQSDVMDKVQVPSGNSKYATNIEERRRRISYKMSLKKKASDEVKEVFGKWIEKSPTGQYQVIRIE